MPENRIDLYDLPGGAVLISAAAAADAEVSARDLSIGGRPPAGGWLFHQGRTLDGRRRLSWIGRPGDRELRAVALSARAFEIRRNPGFSIDDYLAGYATVAERLGLVRQLVESAPAILGIKRHAGFDGLRTSALEAVLREAAEQPPAALFRLAAGMKLLLLADPAAASRTDAVHLLDAGRVGRSTFRPVGFAGGGEARAVLLAQAGDQAVAALVGRDSIAAVPIGRAVSRLGPGDLVALVRNHPQWGPDLARYLLTAP